MSRFKKLAFFGVGVAFSVLIFAGIMLLKGRSGDETAETHEKVQLWEGGPYWATKNVGAKKPEDYGYYFWWGDTVGYKCSKFSLIVNNIFVASDWSNLIFSFLGDNVPTFRKSISILQSEGWIMSYGVLVPKHDAAQAHWGGDWRMPTRDELNALKNNCDWTWTTLNGVKGYIIKGRGAYASNSIFLPCAGSGYGTSLDGSGLFGVYWSSVPGSNSYDAYVLLFDSGYHYTDSYGRFNGLSVRPVLGFTK